MKTMRWLMLAVVCVGMSGSAVFAQQPGFTPVFTPPQPLPGNGDTGLPKLATDSYGGGLSDWVRYQGAAPAVSRDCCEGRDGVHTPLFTELYVRAGPAVPIGGDTLTRELKTGWSIEAGGRLLLFNSELTKAWTVDASIINTYESAGEQNTQFPLTLVVNGVKNTFGQNGVPGVTIKASNRTMAGLGVGREWYLLSRADSDGCRWRVGVDFGGRWGSQRLDLDETTRITDVIAGTYLAAHTDLEIPTRIGIFYTGLRAEWAFTWSDILQRPSNVGDLNLLYTIGLRF